MRHKFSWILIILILLIFVPGCHPNGATTPEIKTVPHDKTWGIYELDLTTQNVSLIYSSADEIFTSSLRLSNACDKYVFTQKTGGQSDENTEIYTISIDGGNLTRLTNNNFFDVYPTWSPDDTMIAFLSQRETDLDIYTISSDGSNEHKLFDSGYHDGDIDWVGDTIVFTSQFAIWKMNSDGTQPEQVTHPQGQGQWGNANLPIGDYDPRLSPDGNRIVFERLEDVSKPHGGYNIFIIDSNGTNEKRLTDNGYSQGLPNWSHSEEQIVYVVAAINEEGKYDLYLMNSDGTDNRNITPDYFPADFLCHAPIFSQDDSKIIFIGQWWQ